MNPSLGSGFLQAGPHCLCWASRFGWEERSCGRLVFRIHRPNLPPILPNPQQSRTLQQDHGRTATPRKRYPRPAKSPKSEGGRAKSPAASASSRPSSTSRTVNPRIEFQSVPALDGGALLTIQLPAGKRLAQIDELLLLLHFCNRVNENHKNAPADRRGRCACDQPPGSSIQG